MKELGDYKKAEISVQDCKESLKEAKMEEAKRLKFEENLIKFAEDLPKRSSIEINDLEFSDDLPTLKCPNKDFPAFSDAVEVRYDVDRGRYGVAARDIALGSMNNTKIEFTQTKLFRRVTMCRKTTSILPP